MISLFKEVLLGSKQVSQWAKDIDKETQDVRQSVRRNGYVLDDLRQELDAHKSGRGIE